MQIIKKDVNKTLIFFLFAHAIIWILVPSLSNTNLPLDNIEALAWSSDFPARFHAGERLRASLAISTHTGAAVGGRNLHHIYACRHYTTDLV